LPDDKPNTMAKSTATANRIANASPTISGSTVAASLYLIQGRVVIRSATDVVPARGHLFVSRPVPGIRPVNLDEPERDRYA
jgi:hypothetical protein